MMTANSPVANRLMESAQEALVEAEQATEPQAIHAAAYQAALRSAAALLTLMGVPRRGGPESIWSILGNRRPAMSQWCRIFTQVAVEGQAANRKIVRLDAEIAVETLRQAREFVEVVRGQIDA